MEQALRATVTFSIIGFLVNFGVGVVAPILPLYALTFHITLVMVGTLVAASGVAKVLLDMPTGLVSDRIGTKRFMVTGLLIVFIAAMIAGLATSYLILLLGMVLQGVGAAIYFTTSYLGISRTAPPARRGAHLSLFISLQFLGSTTGPILGGLVGQSLGLNVPFFVYALLAALSAFTVYMAIPSRSISGGEQGNILSLRRISEVLRNYTLGAINVGLLSISLLRTGLIATIIPLFATRNLSMTPVALGTVLTLSAGFNFLALIPAGSLSDRFGRRPFLFSSLFLSGVAAATIPLAQNELELTLIMSAMGFTLGLSGSIGAYVTDVTPPLELGVAMGLFRTIGDIGTVIGPVLLTTLLPPGMVKIDSTPFLVAGAIMIAASLLLIKAREPIRDSKRHR